MSRIRTIKPEFPQSESMGRISRDARLTFLQLFTIVDDEGRTRGNSRMLASLLFPYDDDAPALIETWLVELEEEGCILRYEVDNTVYLQIVNWFKHQKFDRPTTSKFPPPRRVLDEPSTSPRDNSLPSFRRGEERRRSRSSSLRSEGACAPDADHENDSQPVEVQEPDPMPERPPAASPPAKPAKPVFSPPDWVPLEPWKAFLEMRKAQKSPPTERAKELLVRKLDSFRSQGHDPTAVLDQSTVNAWKDLYEPKENKHANYGNTTRIYRNEPSRNPLADEADRLIAKYQKQSDDGTYPGGESVVGQVLEADMVGAEGLWQVSGTA